MTPLARIAKLLHKARMAGGWIDEDIAQAILWELEIEPKPVAEPENTSSEIGHG